MTFDFNKAIKPSQASETTKPSEPIKPIETNKASVQVASEVATPVASPIQPIKLNIAKLGAVQVAQVANEPSSASSEPQPISSATPSPISGDLSLIADLETPKTYKEQLAELPDLDELAREFQNPDQPDAFDDAALAAVHKACLKLEESIDNAELVREQLTFIMTELRKYPETAAKIWDSDKATMVKALRHNYNVVAFAKQATKKKKEAKSAKANELLAAADAIGLFDDLA